MAKIKEFAASHASWKTPVKLVLEHCLLKGLLQLFQTAFCSLDKAQPSDLSRTVAQWGIYLPNSTVCTSVTQWQQLLLWKGCKQGDCGEWQDRDGDPSQQSRQENRLSLNHAEFVLLFRWSGTSRLWCWDPDRLTVSRDKFITSHP